MTLSPALGDREFFKFCDTVDGPAVRVCGTVSISSTPAVGQSVVSVYDEVTSLTSGILTDVVTYTVPAGKEAYLQRVTFNGQNIATYTLLNNAVTLNKLNTYFSGPLFGEFSFYTASQEGLKLIAGDVITLKVIHSRPTMGDFHGMVQALEVTL